MSETLVSKSKDNIFELFYGLLESRSLWHHREGSFYREFRNLLKELEIVLDVRLKLTNTYDWFYESIVDLLKKMLDVLSAPESDTRSILRLFKKYFKLILFVATNANKLRNREDSESNLDVPKSFFILLRKTDQREYLQIALKYDEEYGQSFGIYSNEYVYYYLKWDEHDDDFIVEKWFYLFLSLFVNTDKNVSDLLYPFWLITDAIEKIPGVATKLVTLREGSLKSTLKVWMKSVFSKEDLKFVLENSKKAAIAHYIRKPISDEEKTTAEVNKIVTEAKLHEKQYDSMPTSDESHTLTSLEIEKLSLENERLKIENETARLVYLEKLSDLITRGIVKADSLRIEINDIPFIVKKNKNIEESKIKTSLDQIIG